MKSGINDLSEEGDSESKASDISAEDNSVSEEFMKKVESTTVVATVCNTFCI